jgi:hypothetical protein
VSSVHHLLNGWVSRNPDVGFLLLAIGLVALALWLAALNSCMSNESPINSNKRLWIILIVCLGPVGALAYFTIRRPQRIRELGW